MALPRSIRTFIICVFSVTIIAGCGSSQKKEDQLSEKGFYDSAKQSLDRNNYIRAIEKLQALEARYPFGRYAEQAQLELIYAYYKNLDLEASEATADRFIRLHPQHPNVDYAYYMRGLAAYAQGLNLLDRYLPTDQSKRDPGPARSAFEFFAELVDRFPNSEYAPDAKARMIHLRNRLAAYEVHVANFYIRRQAFIAAANRGRQIVEHFQQTPSVPDGLVIMVTAYKELGLDELADNSFKVLKANYPNHPNIAEDGSFIDQRKRRNADRSFLSIITFGLLG